MPDHLYGVKAPDEKHYSHAKKKKHHQGEERADREEKVRLGVAAEVTCVAHAPSVPFRANGAV